MFRMEPTTELAQFPTDPERETTGLMAIELGRKHWLEQVSGWQYVEPSSGHLQRDRLRVDSCFEKLICGKGTEAIRRIWRKLG